MNGAVGCTRKFSLDLVYCEDVGWGGEGGDAEHPWDGGAHRDSGPLDARALCPTVITKLGFVETIGATPAVILAVDVDVAKMSLWESGQQLTVPSFSVVWGAFAWPKDITAR